MSETAPLRHVVFDFDGTCTRVEDVATAYEERCLELFARAVQQDVDKPFREALLRVRAASPKLGWTMAGLPSAPAAADPYIAVGEAMRLVLEEQHLERNAAIDRIHHEANDDCTAPWRAEVERVLAAFYARGITIHFVSNSLTDKIAGRLDELLGADTPLRRAIEVLGDARKFVLRELESASIAAPLRARFEQLAPHSGDADGRPILLRRGAYFEALASVWQQEDRAAETLIVGDIFELDLAMPIALGTQVHLVRREPKYPTYPYEIEEVRTLGARGSFGSLGDVLSRLG